MKAIINITGDINTSIIDTLTANICLLNGDGLIVAVNNAWCKFADENPPAPENYGLGINYLQMELVEGLLPPSESGVDLINFQNGIREVLNGKRDEFTYEYPCHSPDEKRWFIGRVKRFKLMDNHYLVISHENITMRVLAEQKVKTLLEEKEILLHEVHHRIKNNLSILNSLFSLQSGTLTDLAAVKALNDASGRIRSMRLLYDKLYRAADYTELPVNDYITELVDEIINNFHINGSIRVEKIIEEFVLGAKTLQILGIVINELLTNVIKHAFSGRESGNVAIHLSSSGNSVILIIEDNGNGIPESIDLMNNSGSGLMLVRALTEQLNGNILIERINGTRITMQFPI